MNTQALAVSLGNSQLDAAKRLHGWLTSWRTSDEAIAAVAAQTDNSSVAGALARAALINQLYNTNVYALYRMAEHISVVFSGGDAPHGPDLVTLIAELPAAEAGGVARRHVSFASKYAHFYVDPEAYPILDSYAEDMLAFHLGKGKSPKSDRYRRFCEGVDQLWAALNREGPRRDLDRYLWIAGQYRSWQRKNGTRLGAEIRALFEAPSAEQAKDLARLSG